MKSLSALKIISMKRAIICILGFLISATTSAQLVA